MKKNAAILLFLMQSLSAMATNPLDCQAAGGNFLTGTVVEAPHFAAGKNLGGVRLSHTHVQLLADQDGQTYDVAIDNVFALDFVENSDLIPASLAAIYVNERLELCGNLYSGGIGIHWVHTNCNEPATHKAPDGWVKEIAPDGAVGDNLESSQTYCYLWKHNQRKSDNGQ